MTNSEVAPDAAAIMEQVIVRGDLSQLSPEDRARYYMEVCKSIGLNPLTRPFEYIRLNGLLTLYARKDCTEQLRKMHGVSIIELVESNFEGVFIVTAKVSNKDGRTDAAKGAVFIAGLKGEALANALMKCETKAKRRATLSICGLGLLDESEIDDIGPNNETSAIVIDPAGIEQGSPEWHRERAGKVTASRISDMLAKSRQKNSGWGVGRANYKAQLISERLTGIIAPTYQSDAMRQAVVNEPLARDAYASKTKAHVQMVGFVNHPTINMAGASPDGLVGDDGLLEIKCPNTATHISIMQRRVIPADYLQQMTWQMACTGRQWCDFVSFDPRLPPETQLFIHRFPRDNAAIEVLETQVIDFLTEVETELAQLQPAQGRSVAVIAIPPKVTDIVLPPSHEHPMVQDGLPARFVRGMKIDGHELSPEELARIDAAVAKIDTIWDAG